MYGYKIILLVSILKAVFMGFSNIIVLTESHCMDNTFTNIGSCHSCLTALSEHHGDGYVYSPYTPGHLNDKIPPRLVYTAETSFLLSRRNTTVWLQVNDRNFYKY